MPSRQDRFGYGVTIPAAAAHGRDMSLPDLRTILASDCEHKTAAPRKDQCQVFYPQLRELKREGAP